MRTLPTTPLAHEITSLLDRDALSSDHLDTLRAVRLWIDYQMALHYDAMPFLLGSGRSNPGPHRKPES